MERSNEKRFFRVDELHPLDVGPGQYTIKRPIDEYVERARKMNRKQVMISTTSRLDPSHGALKNDNPAPGTYNTHLCPLGTSGSGGGAGGMMKETHNVLIAEEMCNRVRR